MTRIKLYNASWKYLLQKRASWFTLEDLFSKQNICYKANYITHVKETLTHVKETVMSVKLALNFKTTMSMTSLTQA